MKGKRGEEQEAGEPARGSRLSVVPLAVLLPKLGELSNLSKLAPFLERKLADLQAEQKTDDNEAPRAGSEESMLNQVLQWLSIGRQE